VEIPIHTVIQGIDWPALPSHIGAGRLAALFQLEQSQWWPETKLRKQQFIQIDALLRHCVEHVPYYREILSKVITADMLTEEQWQHIPLLTRDKLQQAGNMLRTTAMPAGHGKVTLQRTSGSTGKPVEALATDITIFFWDIFTLRDHLWQRRDFSRKLSVIRFNQNENAGPPHGLQATNWGRACNGLFETAASSLLSIFTPISEQVAWLKKENPYYLITHPSVLQELALYCQRENIQLPSLHEVCTISEALPDGLRELCREVWGVKLVDMYTTIELGYLALQCPEHDHYHVQSESVLLEVLDDSGKPCAPGQIGKVVVTALHNFAMPLIRYEPGDFAEVGEPCPCGRGLPVIKRILGRYRNLITLPNGERRWPKFDIAKMLKIAPVRQFQATQHSLQDVEFLLVMENPLTHKSRQELLDLFHVNLHPSLNITIREVDSIPRSKSGKYEEFISKL
jgi:phenylacetate-CoA ligase